MGFRIALGTDSLASNDDLSLFAEMRAFRKTFPNVAASETVAMATTVAAGVIGEGARLGRLAEGYLAKPIAIPYDARNYGDYEVYEAIIAFAHEPTVDFAV